MTRADQLRVAAEAVCDMRTVAKWLRGERVRGTVAERIEAAVRKLGVAR